MNPVGRLIAIGDVHGCVHALDTLLEVIQPRQDDCLVFLGDVIDQGRDSAAVLDRILQLKKNCRVVLIRGNHEEMFQAAYDGEGSLRYWENCGGVATLNSYRFGGTLSDIPEEHLELIRSAQAWFETETVILTHANFMPDLPMEEQPEYQLRWALLVPEEVQPHVSGKTVFVGHTEQRNSEILDLGDVICIDTACWRHGWLTAMDCHTRTCWQASRWGVLREAEAPSTRSLLSASR